MLCDSVLGEGFVTRVLLIATPEQHDLDIWTSRLKRMRATALEKLVGSAGRQLRVDVAQRRGPPRQRREYPHSVFIVAGWDIDTNFVEDMLDDILGPGSFEVARLATDNQTGHIRGFGHVDLRTRTPLPAPWWNLMAWRFSASCVWIMRRRH